jgi:hypothetical protein
MLSQIPSEAALNQKVYKKICLNQNLINIKSDFKLAKNHPQTN